MSPASAFRALKPNSILVKTLSSPQSSSALNMFKKKEPKPEVDPADYWQGEWICADCGYIYDMDVDGGGLYFEELKKGTDGKLFTSVNRDEYFVHQTFYLPYLSQIILT